MKKYDQIRILLIELMELLERFKGNYALVGRLGKTLSMIGSATVASQDVDAELRFLNRGLFGMGSITDQTYVPKAGTQMEPRDASRECERLCSDLRHAIESVIGGEGGRGT